MVMNTNKFILAATMLLAVSSVAHALGFSSENITNLQGEADFKFRFSSMVQAAGTVTWTSTSVAAHGSASGKTGADIDTIVGQMVEGNILQPPFGWVAFMKMAWSGIPDSGSFTGSAGALGVAYLYLNEVDPSGAVVKNMKLANLGWTTGGVVAHGEDLSSVNMSCAIGQQTRVTFVIISSKVLGKIDLASAPVCPKTLETILEISHTYQDAANHLELGVGIGTIDADVTGNAIMIKKGGSNVYLTMAEHAVVDGTIGDAEVSGYVDGSFDSPTLDIWMKVLVGAKYDAKMTTVSFPAGAKHILYDPALGQGDKILFGAASGLVPSLLLLVALLALLL